MNLVLVARSIDALQDLADSLGARYGVRCVVLQADLAAADAVKQIQSGIQCLVPATSPYGGKMGLAS